MPFGFFQLTPTGNVTCPSTPSFSMTFPSGATIPNPANAYVAFYDPNNAGAGWNTIEGTASQSGTTLIWTSATGTPIALVAGTT